MRLLDDSILNVDIIEEELAGHFIGSLLYRQLPAKQAKFVRGKKINSPPMI